MTGTGTVAGVSFSPSCLSMVSNKVMTSDEPCAGPKLGVYLKVKFHAPFNSVRSTIRFLPKYCYAPRRLRIHHPERIDVLRSASEVGRYSSTSLLTRRGCV